MVRLWTADVPDVLTTSQSPLAHTLSRCPPVAARAVASIIARESSKHPQTRLPADHSAQTSQCNISLAGNLQPHPQSATADTLSYASTRYSSISSIATVRSDPCLLRSFAKPMGEPLPPPQQQCAAPLPNRPEEEALHLDHPTPASADRQPPMQTSADAAAASTHADRQTDAPPLFWSTRHSRSTSYHSISHLGPGTIQLEDHSEEQHEQSQGCWARSVTVDDYTVVSGSSGLGAYVVWSLTVSTLKGGDMSIRKRYSEFDRLRENLVKAFPHAEGSIPQLPRKSVVSRFRPRFLEQRKNGLSHFISCILLNPEFSSSPILKDFIFS